MGQIKWIRQLALAVALFLLGALAIWLETKHRPQKEAKEEEQKKVFALKDSSVRTLRLTDSTRSIELQCLDTSAKLCKPGDQSKWEISAPRKSKADDSNANSLLSSLSNLNATEVIDLKEETEEKRQALLKEYGLDAQARAGAATRKASMKIGDIESTLYLGASHPIGEGIFALVEKDGKPEESRVLVIPSFFKSSFEHDLSYWRDKKLLTLASHEVGSFALDSSRTQVQGERKDGQWQLKSLGKTPEEFAGDTETIEGLLSSAAHLSAKEFASESKSDAKAKAALQGTRSLLSFSITKEGKTEKGEKNPPIEIKFFGKEKPAKKLYVTVSNLDPLFELDASSEERLNKSVKDLRLSKLITSMERFGAKRVEFAGKPVGAKPLLIKQENSKWILSGEEKSEIDQDKVTGTLDKLSGNRIREFLSGSGIPAGEEEGLKISIGDDSSPAKRQFVFWKKGSRLYARDLLSKRKEAFLVDSAVNDGLPWEPNFYKKKP